MSTRVSMSYHEFSYGPDGEYGSRGNKGWHVWFDCGDELFEAATYNGGFVLRPRLFALNWRQMLNALDLHPEDHDLFTKEVEEWLASDYGQKALKRGEAVGETIEAEIRANAANPHHLLKGGNNIVYHPNPEPTKGRAFEIPLTTRSWKDKKCKSSPQD